MVAVTFLFNFPPSPTSMRKIRSVFSLTLIFLLFITFNCAYERRGESVYAEFTYEQHKVFSRITLSQPPTFHLLFTWYFILSRSINGTKTKLHTSCDLVLCGNTTHICFPWHSCSRVLSWGHFPPSEVLPLEPLLPGLWLEH